MLSMVLMVVLAVSAQASDMQTAIREADRKLQANGFLLDDDIDEILEAEQTPNVLEKVTDAQQRAIVAELDEAKAVNLRESEKFGLGIQDDLERSIYQQGVFNNKMLKSRRAIAKKYGIQIGDVFTVEDALMPAEIFYEGDKVYEGTGAASLRNYPPAVLRKRDFVMEHIFVDTKWEPEAMTERFGKYERYDPSDGNPKILQMFYFKDIDMTFLVNMLSFKVVTWRSGRADR